MNSSSCPKTRGLPLSAPSAAELQRLRAKLAFYELPITAFDCAVDNDPRDAVSKRRLEMQRDKAKMTRGKKKKKNAKRADHKDGLMKRLARRIRALCVLSTRVTRNMGGSKTPPNSSSFSDELQGALNARLPLYLDENTRFRLQLAGLRVPSSQAASQSHILTQ